MPLLRFLALLGSLCFILIIPEMGGQVLPTTISLSVSDGTSSGTLHAVATVKANGTPVPVGEVVFTIDGQDTPAVQVVSTRAPASQVGSATLNLSLLCGAYQITARYLGTSEYGMSASASSQATIGGFAGAALTLSSSPDFSYRFQLQAREQLSIALGSISLQDLTAASALGTSKLNVLGTGLRTGTSDLQLPTGPSVFAIGDLSGKGTHDIAIANSSKADVEIYLEQADGTYLSSGSAAAASMPTAILLRDLDGDGLADIAVLSSGTNSVYILLQQQAHPGTFASAASVPVGNGALAMTSADVNGDGLPDLLVANFADDTVSILLNSTATPGAFSQVTTLNTQNGPAALITADLLGNGRNDLAVANFYDGSISVFEAKPSTATLFAAPKTVFRVGAGPSGIVAADLNGDGLPDLVVSNSLDGTLSVLPGIPFMPGQYPQQFIISGFKDPAHVSVIHTFAPKQAPDLLVADATTGMLTVLHNDGASRFSTRTQFALGETLSQAAAVYSFGSGSAMFAALDPSLSAIHFAVSKWVAEGPLAGTPTPSPLVHTLQARYATPQSSIAVVSNTISTSPVQLKSQSISFDSLPSVVYGAQPITLHASASSGLPVEFSIRRGRATLEGAVLSAPSAGMVVLQADQAGGNGYAAASPVQRTLYVAKAPLTVTPSSAIRLYGSTNPSFSGVITGLLGSDVLHVDYVTSSDSTTPVGTYSKAPNGISAVVESTSTAENYAITTSIGTLTICPTVISQAALPNASCALISKQPTSTAPITSGSGSTTPPGASTPVSGPPSGPPSSAPVTTGAGGSGSGVSPSGAPITQPSPTNKKNEAHAPVLIAPVSSPQKKEPSRTPVVVPIPVPVPSLPPLPSIGSLLPNIAVRIGGAGRTSGTVRHEETELLLLEDRRIQTRPEWVSVTVTLECATSERGRLPVLISDGDAAIATLLISPNREQRARIPVRTPDPLNLGAHFAGSSACNRANSRVITIQPAARASVPVAEAATEDAIVEQSDEGASFLSCLLQDGFHPELCVDAGSNSLIRGMGDPDWLMLMFNRVRMVAPEP